MSHDATEAAAHMGESFESLGSSPHPRLPHPAMHATPPEDLVGIVVCAAAAEASDVSLRSMRSQRYVVTARTR